MDGFLKGLKLYPSETFDILHSELQLGCGKLTKPWVGGDQHKMYVTKNESTWNCDIHASFQETNFSDREQRDKSEIIQFVNPPNALNYTAAMMLPGNSAC